MHEISEHIRIKLGQSTDLPSLPAAAVEILDLARNPTSTMGQVADVIGYDPALASKLLKISNSPLYGQRRKSSNIRQAVMLLGLNSTLMLTLSFSLFSSLRDEQDQGLDYDFFWRRSLLSSTAARLLAMQSKSASPEDAFLGSLLQDIGMAAMDKALKGFYLRLDGGNNNHETIINFEKKSIDCDHSAVSAWLLKQWNFPEHLVEAIKSSHHAEDLKDLQDVSSLKDCIALSGLIADSLFAADKQGGEPQVTCPAQWMGDSFEPLIEALCIELPVVESLFEMSLLEGGYSDKLLADAKELMLMRGLSTSKELTATRNKLEDHLHNAQRLEQEAVIDHLTGLSNRKQLDRALAEEFVHATKNNWPLSLIFIDLDKFKHINDQFGHSIGDDILKFCAKILLAYTRDQEAVYRYGGEEFVVLLPGGDAVAASAAANRIVEAIHNTPCSLANQEMISLSCSAGVSTLDMENSFEHPKAFVNAADQAMYQAKENGGNRVAIHS